MVANLYDRFIGSGTSFGVQRWYFENISKTGSVVDIIKHHCRILIQFAEETIMSILDIMASVIAIAVSVFALYRSYKMVPREMKSTDADTMHTYEQIAELSASRALRTEERITALEKDVESQRQTIELQSIEIEKLKCENIDLKDWAERLVHQVQALGEIPVPFKREKTNPRKDAQV